MYPQYLQLGALSRPLSEISHGLSTRSGEAWAGAGACAGAQWQPQAPTVHWRAKVKGRRYSWRAFWRSSSGRGPPAAGWAGGLTPLPPDQALFDTDDRALVPR